MPVTATKSSITLHRPIQKLHSRSVKARQIFENITKLKANSHHQLHLWNITLTNTFHSIILINDALMVFVVWQQIILPVKKTRSIKLLSVCFWETQPNQEQLQITRPHTHTHQLMDISNWTQVDPTPVVFRPTAAVKNATDVYRLNAISVNKSTMPRH